jgi:hypothetical protein
MLNLYECEALATDIFAEVEQMHAKCGQTMCPQLRRELIDAFARALRRHMSISSRNDEE